MDNILYAFGIFGVGIIASFINIMAGGGSLLTLGSMMLIGLDAPVANGTNRIGLLIEGLAGLTAYRVERKGDIRTSLRLGLFALPGAVIGAIFAINVSNALFQRILAVVMIVVLLTLVLPKKQARSVQASGRRKSVVIYPIMFVIGLYGGFIQAGVGFLIMAALRHLLHLNLIEINEHKLYIVLLYTVPILFIFGVTHNIHWLCAACLAAGNALGAWISVKISVKKGEGVIKLVLSLAIGLMAAKFLLTF
jgi:hypothetical protein